MTSSLEASPGGLSLSPSSSGRASPVSTKWSQFANDETPTKDKAFRRYASGVERSLSLFDTALQEWADYISFLGRLLKSLQARPPLITTVPSKSIVAKRLAQCLNPSLPSGVHQKTLEVYAYVFSMIGREALSRDLPLYLPGISSTLSFASLSVRGPFLEIFETQLLHLERKALRPALKAIILALLPGLEEETSDEFDRTLRLIESFKLAIRPPWSEDLNHGHATGDEYFWQCFFLASITGTNRRLGALAYLTRNLPKLAGPSARDSQLANIVTSPEPGLLVRCFAAGLLDEHILIQRGFQDLLKSHLPLHSDVLQKHVKPEDLELLLNAAASIVTRREMSLNRRLWSWLLGPEPITDAAEGNPESPISPANHPDSSQLFSSTKYFEEFGLRPLTRALLRVIASDTPNAVERARPFRICLSLMDRWEIGGLVVPDIFLPIVRSVRKYKLSGASRQDFADVLKSASVFFDGVESGLIWGEIMTLLSQTIHETGLSVDQRLDRLSLVSFMASHFNVKEEEMILIHVPLNVLGTLATLGETHTKDISSTSIQQAVLEVIVALLETVPERAFQPSEQNDYKAIDSTGEHTAQTGFSNVEIVQRIKKFYAHDQGNLEVSPSPLSPQEIAGLILREVIHQAKDAMLTHRPFAELALKIRLLVLVLSKVTMVKKEQVAEILSAITSRITDIENQSFIALSSTIQLVTTLSSRELVTGEQIGGLVEHLVRLTWSYLGVARPKHHVEAVRLLWQIQHILPLEDRSVESAICTIIVERRRGGTFASQEQTPGHAFAILWAHTMLGSSLHSEKQSLKSPVSRILYAEGKPGQLSPEVMLQRPLFLILDALSDDSTQLCATVTAWLQSLSFVDRLFDVFIGRFLAINFIGMDAIARGEHGNYPHSEHDEVDDCLYYIQVLSCVLRCASNMMWETFAEANIAKCANGAGVLESADRHHLNFLTLIVRICLRAIWGHYSGSDAGVQDRISHLHRAALGLLHQILSTQYARSLTDFSLEETLILRLHRSLDEDKVETQSALLEVVLDTLKLRVTTREIEPTIPPSSPHGFKRPSTIDSVAQSRLSQQVDGGENRPRAAVLTLPTTLLQCLQAGLASATSRDILDNWIEFLVSCLPLYADSIFQVLIPLVETLCSQSSQVFNVLYKTFQASSEENDSIPEASLLSLLAGLEHVLARAHDQLLRDEVKAPPVKPNEPQQGFFGNMVSGVFTTETAHARSATANDRLTVLLCFQDALKICFQIWSWGTRETFKVDDETTASFHYTNLRMRNRARRLLEHLFAAETLECVETIIELWQAALETGSDASRMLDLLQVLDGARPKYTIPAIFDAIYSRSNPGALEPLRRSSLTSTLSEATLVMFLVNYTKSLDDDAMDEIWSDCITFLRDILTNPFPHRQTLPQLLEFAAILGEKVDNTNFGEQKKMRRELGDLFIRLLTAIFTTKPISFTDSANETETRSKSTVRDVVDILAATATNLPKVLVEQDRILLAANTISTNVIGPTFRSKQYPENVSRSTLTLLYQLSRLPNTQKLWKKDLNDAFNDMRFFSNDVSLVEGNWLQLIKQWLISDKEKLPEILTRLVPPTTAGIVFGVGATSARLEADRKAQLNLRRVATIVLAMDDDSCASDLPAVLEKIVELLAATSTSSPSSTTRADIYLLIRALVLKISPVHLGGLWPVVNTELQAAVSSVIAPDNSTHADTYNNFSTLQACKLLDCLICIAPDEFQLHEWLFVTDTIDAVYRPSNSEPTSLVDEVSMELGSLALKSTHFEGSHVSHSSTSEQRRPLIRPGSIEDEGVCGRKDELIGKVLRPFFSQLSIFAFESVYSMGKPDVEECRKLLLHDIFDERSIIKAL